MSFRITIAGDSALNVVLADAISEEASRYVKAACDVLQAASLPGVIELVPTFCSVMVCYDPCLVSFGELSAEVASCLEGLKPAADGCRRIVEIPVCYGGDLGPDLNFVAQHAGMTEEEVVAIHSGTDYLINMLGFLPGFAYLGGLDERLHTPRLDSPRTSIPAGSVGIGGAQTGVYPLASPGGWQLIGRTPVRPYDPLRNPPILYEAGDYLRFVPISRERYDELEREVARGVYECRIVDEGGDC